MSCKILYKRNSARFARGLKKPTDKAFHQRASSIRGKNHKLFDRQGSLSDEFVNSAG